MELHHEKLETEIKHLSNKPIRLQSLPVRKNKNAELLLLIEVPDDLKTIMARHFAIPEDQVDALEKLIAYLLPSR